MGAQTYVRRTDDACPLAQSNKTLIWVMAPMGDIGANVQMDGVGLTARLHKRSTVQMKLTTIMVSSFPLSYF